VPRCWIARRWNSARSFRLFPQSRRTKEGAWKIGRWSLATWTRDGYSYSVVTQAHPLTEEELSELVKTVR